MSTLPRQSLNARQVETVERIYTESSRLLDEIGHEQLTMRMVAQRAGVSPATVYNYFASKDHLFAELFWRLLDRDAGPRLTGRTPVKRLQQLVRHLADLIASTPALSAAVNKSFFSGDPEVERLRGAIGRLWVRRFREAIGPEAEVESVVLTTLAFAVSGALLQAGFGVFTYDRLATHLEGAVAVIMRGAG
jgi:AcrR family transcriptional regulator